MAFQFDLQKLTQSPHAPKLVSLMMFLSDAEKLAYLRKLHLAFWKPPAVREQELRAAAYSYEIVLADHKQIERWDYFAQHVGSYTMCLLISHLYEVSLIIAEMEGSSLFPIINGSQELLKLYEGVNEYISGSKKPLLDACMLFRSNVIFHYNTTGKVIKKQLEKAMKQKGLQKGIMNDAIGITIYDLPEVVLNEYFEETFGKLYPGKQMKELQELLNADSTQMLNDFRTFAYKLVNECLKQQL
jgi:hypothetical protein